MKAFTLVSTVFNEALRLQKSIDDIENQLLKPSEIVIVDAGSTDGTYEKLLEWSQKSSITINILQKYKCNVAEGRNLAINSASHGIIVSTDFGCRFHKEWLKSLLEPFNDKGVRVVGGAFTVRENEIESLSAKANYLLSNGYNQPLDESFIPSSRSIAYYKSAWKEAGGYPEWLTLAADDLVFGMVLRSKGYRFYIVDKPYVYWGRYEPAKSYGKEAFRYGLGDGEANVNKRQFLSKILETGLRYCFLPALLLLSLFIFSFNQPFYFFIFLVLFGLGFRSYWYAFKMYLKYRSAKYNFKVSLYSLYIIEVSRINYIKGYYKGYFKSTNKQRAEAARLKVILS
jgi:glycosyltransferase involved in cell wall biosynthesis